MSLDRIARDGVELVENLRSRFGDRKIIVLGHSFGSIVAVEMVRRAPEQFALTSTPASSRALPRSSTHRSPGYARLPATMQT